MTNDRFEAARFLAQNFRDVSSVNAEDKLPFWVSRQWQLALTT